MSLDQDRQDRIAVIRTSYDRIQDAEEFRQGGQLSAALEVCRDLVTKFPDYWAAWHTLGLVNADLSQDREALECFARATMLNPENILSLTGLAGAYLGMRNPRMAATVLEAARTIDPSDPSVLFTQAELRFFAHEFELALADYQRTLEADPAIVAALLKAGRCFRETGRLAQAAEMFQRGLALDPNAFTALNELAQMPPSLVGIDVLDWISRSKGPLNVTPTEAAIALDFARGAAHHRRGNHPLAWTYFTRANRAAFAGRGISLADLDQRQAEQLAELDKLATETPLAAPHPACPQSLLILGCSRSGKTTLESLVARLDGVQRTYEDAVFEDVLRRTMNDAALLTDGRIDLLPKQLQDAFVDNYVTEARRRGPTARLLTNTNPFLLADTPRLLGLVPNLRIVFVKRQADDIAINVYMTHYQDGNDYAYDLATIRSHIEHYDRSVDVLAARYPDRVRMTSYEEIVADPSAVLRNVAGFCGLSVPNGTPVPAVYDDRACATPYLGFMQAETARSR